jgi:hypothetical protein
MKYVNVTADTTVILHTGRGGKLPAGRYEVADLDGTDGELFLVGPGGDLVQADPNDPSIIDYETMDYTHDRRVWSRSDGTIVVTGGVLYTDTDRVVFPDGDYWFARGLHTTDCDIHDPGDRYRTRLNPFCSAEEAVCHIIGAPSDLVADGDGYRMYLLLNEDGTPFPDPVTGRTSALLVQPTANGWNAFEEDTDAPYVFVGATPEAAADAYFGAGV